MRPFTFKRNRVGRIYEGGRLIDELQGAAKPSDGLKPEEWIASAVRACNDGGKDPDEGVSAALLDGEEKLFTDLIAKEAEALFGKAHLAKHGPTPGFLTKLLDSAIRLPLQAHPDREAAKRLYGSKFGKTEAWIVLDGRHGGPEEPYVLFGFNERLDEKAFREEAISGEMPRSLEMVRKQPVKPWDVMLIRGGVPHAIGAGNLILEIMEPSDWVVQPEARCGKQKLSVADRFGKIDPKASLDVFHFKGEGVSDAWERAFLKPRKLDSGEGYELSSLIDRVETGFFGAMRLSLSGDWKWNGHGAPFGVGVAVEGSCEIVSEGKTLKLSQGGSVFIPASCEDAVFRGKAEIVFALPPA